MLIPLLSFECKLKTSLRLQTLLNLFVIGVSVAVRAELLEF